MLKIVILGSNGQLGSDLLQILTTANLGQVIGLDRSQINATDPELKLKFNATCQDANYIINCIATTNVDGCEDQPGLAFQVNSAFVLQLAQFCQSQAITLLHISTDYVFDGTHNHSYRETDHANPLNVYGLSKYAGELAVARYAAKYFILRVSSLFGIAGASGKGGNFVTTMLRLAQEKTSWSVIDDQITCPTHTLDVARAILALIAQRVTEYGIYHCVSNSSCSWFEFAQEILRQTSHDVTKIKPISYRDYQFKAVRPQYAVMDCAKLAKYYVLPSYQQALSEYMKLNNYQKTPAGVAPVRV